MNHLYRSLKLKIGAGVLLFTFALIFILTSTFYITVKNIIVERFSISSKNLATAMAANIMFTSDDYENLVLTKDVTSEYYLSTLNFFKTIMDDDPYISYIYTCHKISETDTIFILDSDNIINPTNPIGTPEVYNELTLKVIETGQAEILRAINTEYFGVLIGGMAPLYNKDAEIIGALGVDINMNSVDKLLGTILLIIIIASIFILIVILAILTKFIDPFLSYIFKDKLTNAYSKKHLEKLYKGYIKSKKAISVMMLDLDHFKNINDTYGHPFGDVVLKTVSQIIIDSIRKDDSFIRYGGEEFLLFISDLPVEDTLVIAERIRRTVNLKEIYNREHKKYITMSISIGVVSADSNQKLDKIIENADKALYKAKETRNKVIYLS